MDNDVNYFFNELLTKKDNFSHAYLFDCSNIENCYPQVLKLVKNIICPHNCDSSKCTNVECNICYLIEKNCYDDFCLINPEGISIKKEEIDSLMKKMETKSLIANGKRVYVIYGIERLHNDMSNKLLKFLEEPPEDVYSIILTEHIDNVLPTIISRCQIFTIKSEENDINNEKIENMKSFLREIMIKKEHTICYENDYFEDELKNRELMDISFEIIEKILFNMINKKLNFLYEEKFILNEINFELEKLIKMIEITTQKRKMIMNNINLNLMIDRYIMDLVEV